jgi:deoxyribodipyrimidine photolyase-related protein
VEVFAATVTVGAIMCRKRDSRGILMQALIVFPHQLFRSNAALLKTVGRAVLVEEPLLFTQYRFHKQKLVLHRASMQMHAQYLRASGRVDYLDVDGVGTTLDVLERLREQGVSTLHYIDVVDDWLERRICSAAKTCGLTLVRHESPMFISSKEALQKHFSTSHPLLARFYAAQRIEHDILMDEQRPVGGRWSFDAENRKRLPRGAEVPRLPRLNVNRYVQEAQEYVEHRFPDNPGRVDPFEYPVTYADARLWLEDFVRNRLPKFGDYEDAISAGHDHLYHSVLTPMLNTGLLTPREVLEAALARSDTIPLNSLEGFVRQILGWREYVRGAYLFKGRAQRTANFSNHSRALPAAFWQASVNVEPVDRVIRRLLHGAYAHHIERLMVLSTFMLLCEFEPDQVYRWFMEMFIDAYDWVMVPNVYGMGLFADGGRITTKPYFCGSNYLLKMSDFKRGAWCTVWDGLYWRFVAKNRAFLATHHRLKVTVRALERMPAARREGHIAAADAFLSAL